MKKFTLTWIASLSLGALPFAQTTTDCPVQALKTALGGGGCSAETAVVSTLPTEVAGACAELVAVDDCAEASACASTELVVADDCAAASSCSSELVVASDDCDAVCPSTLTAARLFAQPIEMCPKQVASLTSAGSCESASSCESAALVAVDESASCSGAAELVAESSCSAASSCDGEASLVRLDPSPCVN